MGIVVIIIIGIVLYAILNRHTKQASESQSNFTQPAKMPEQSHTDEDPNNAGTHTALSSLKQAHKFFETTSQENRQEILRIKDTILTIVINNIRCLPKDILNMKYTQKAIIAFVFRYPSLTLKLSLSGFLCASAATSLVAEELDKMGVLDTTIQFYEIREDKQLSLELPVAMKMFQNVPIEQNTCLLLIIERYMEAKLGHKVRYIGQRPADNPLNK